LGGTKHFRGLIFLLYVLIKNFMGTFGGHKKIGGIAPECSPVAIRGEHGQDQDWIFCRISVIFSIRIAFG